MMSTLPVYRVRRLRHPIEIDGNLGKQDWRMLAIGWLVPSHGKKRAPEQTTAFRAGWNDEFLYLAFHCEDRYIYASHTHRDDPLYNEEVVEAFLCPTGDLHRYYEFEVSPRNVVFDATVNSPNLNREAMEVDTAWTCEGMRSAVKVEGTIHPSARPTDHPHPKQDSASSWSVEIAIPFASIGGKPRKGAEWRANFYRIERAGEPEFSAWSPTLKDPADFHVPERFGRLEFEDQ